MMGNCGLNGNHQIEYFYRYLTACDSIDKFIIAVFTCRTITVDIC